MNRATIHEALLTRLESSSSSRDNLVARLLKEKLSSDLRKSSDESHTAAQFTTENRKTHENIKSHASITNPATRIDHTAATQPLDESFRSYYTLSLLTDSRENNESDGNGSLLRDDRPIDNSVNDESERSNDSNISTSILLDKRHQRTEPDYLLSKDLMQQSTLSFDLSQEIDESAHAIDGDKRSVSSVWKPKMTTEQREALWRAKVERYQQSLENRERKRLELLENESKTCTFKPEIHKVPDFIKSQVTTPPRSQSAPLKKSAVKADLHHRKIDYELKDCTFSPQIHVSPNHLKNRSKTPVFQRAGEVQKEKRANLQRLVQKTEAQDENLTYKPSISQASKVIAKERMKKQNGSDSHQTEVFKRLSTPASVIEPKLRNKQAWEENVAQQYPFHPTLSPETKKIVNSKSPSRRSFYERQILWQKQKIEKDLQKASESVQDDLFQPRISQSSQKIVSEKRQREGESQKDIIERLSAVENTRKSVERKLISEEHYSQYTFKPEISQNSKTIGKASTLDELASKDSIEQTRRKAKENYELSLKDELTFKPAIASSVTPPSERLMIDMENPDRMWEKLEGFLRSREASINQMKSRLEENRMKDYTFQPVVNPKTPQSLSKSVQVKGLGK
eukprot:TRINITY_DN74_c1_g1_i1.p1 TRINITY_DN74_c1_g1~~TRINITY_DN74_c1_g1_i1.p1  ORF type:complete len:625 (-),score=134.61 TRINITY_DN74_c1_g1_i1:726-2600(-)